MESVWRSSRYAANLEAWLKIFPRHQLKVMATEQLETDPSAALADVVAFLGLPKIANPLPAAEKGARYCVTGKRGVMDDSASRAWRAGRLDGTSDEDGDGGAGIGRCETR